MICKYKWFNVNSGEFILSITMKKVRVAKFVVILALFIIKPDGCVFEALAMNFLFRS
jgi:hypothetical protein